MNGKLRRARNEFCMQKIYYSSSVFSRSFCVSSSCCIILNVILCLAVEYWIAYDINTFDRFFNRFFSVLPSVDLTVIHSAHTIGSPWMWPTFNCHRHSFSCHSHFFSMKIGWSVVVVVAQQLWFDSFFSTHFVLWETEANDWSEWMESVNMTDTIESMLT